MPGEIQARNEMNSALVGGEPFKTYKKTILGKVFITVMDALTKETEGILLTGDPNKNDPDCFYFTWSKAEDIYFNKAPYNREHLKSGRIIEVKNEKPKEVERTIEVFTDEELTELVNSPFLKLQNALNKTESEAVLFRILNIAQNEEKSDKIIRAIESRLSEVQELEYIPKNRVIVEK